MDLYKLEGFLDFQDMHLFRKDSQVSECGKVVRGYPREILFQTDYLPIKDARTTLADLSNQGNLICGICVGSLYHMDDVSKFDNSIRTKSGEK